MRGDRPGFQALYTLIKSGLVYGTSYAKITWREDYVRKGFHLPEVIEPQMQALMQDDSIEEITAGSVDYTYLPMTGGMNGMVWSKSTPPLVAVRGLNGKTSPPAWVHTWSLMSSGCS